jgi:hypothetical protein
MKNMTLILFTCEINFQTLLQHILDSLISKLILISINDPNVKMQKIWTISSLNQEKESKPEPDSMHLNSLKAFTSFSFDSIS